MLFHEHLYAPISVSPEEIEEFQEAQVYHSTVIRSKILGTLKEAKHFHSTTQQGHYAPSEQALLSAANENVHLGCMGDVWLAEANNSSVYSIGKIRIGTLNPLWSLVHLRDLWDIDFTFDKSSIFLAIPYGGKRTPFIEFTPQEERAVTLEMIAARLGVITNPIPEKNNRMHETVIRKSIRTLLGLKIYKGDALDA